MTNIYVFLLLAFTICACSAPKLSQVSLARNLKPVNFTAANYDNTVIKSEQTQNHWNKRFAYSINARDHSPEFFYAIAHADRIIAYIKPPSINFIFKKLQVNLRRYGITTPIDLSLVETIDQQPQVILDCIKFESQ